MANFRFAESKASARADVDLYNLHYTDSGLKCHSTCAPDEADPLIDKCQVKTGSTMTTMPCVPVGDLNVVRDRLKGSFEAQRVELVNLTQIFIAKMNQFAIIQQAYNNLLSRRQAYNKLIGEIQKMKAFLKETINQLGATADKLDELYVFIGNLKGILLELVANYETPEGDCTGFPGYEKELEGDGLVGHYYNNVQFSGEPKKQVDQRIKFFWANTAPQKGFNPNNYSIEWQGYIRPPKTGDYTFFCEADDGCIVWLNDTVILQDNMLLEPSFNVLDVKYKVMKDAIKNGKWDDFIKPPNPKGPGRYPRNPKSKNSVPLVAGDYVPIRIRMYHSVHNNLVEDGNSYVYLYWQSPEISKQVIPSAYLFTEIRDEAMTPKNYNAQQFLLTNLQENDEAFMDDVSYRLKYIPLMFRGLKCLKMKSEYEAPMIYFEVASPVSVYIAIDAAEIPPFDNKFKELEQEMALIKVNTEGLEMLPKLRNVRGIEDIPMKIYQANFGAGSVKILTPTVKPIKMVAWIAPLGAGPPMSCGGDELELSRDANFIDTCEATSNEGDQDCTAALGEGYWKASSNIGESMTIKFKSKIKPTKIIIMQSDNKENMAKKIIVDINDVTKEDLNMIQDVKQEFAFTQTAMVDSVKITIENTYGGKNAGGRFIIVGVPCADPEAEQKKSEQAKKDALGLKDVIKPVPKTCTDNMDMESDKMIITCLEACAPREEECPRNPTGFSMAGHPCVAAQVYYKGKPEATSKSFGIKRIPNEVALGEDTPKFVFMFDASLVNEAKEFASNEEVDVLDPDLCYIRAKVKAVNGDAVSIDYKSEMRSYTMANVHKCGDRLPFVPCSGPATTPIKIKFAPVGVVKYLDESNIGKFSYDTGEIAKQNGVFFYGWTKKPRMDSIDGITSEKDKNVLIAGTAAFVDSVDPVWFINVPNGKYDVKVTCKIVENKQNNSTFKTDPVLMQFRINEVEIDTEPMPISGEIIHDKTNINVTTGKIQLTWVAGSVSLVSIEIAAQQTPSAGSAVKKEVARGTFLGGDCNDNSLNCLFDEAQLTTVKCDGIFVKIGSKVSVPEMACRFKCVPKDFATMEECDDAKMETTVCISKGAKYQLASDSIAKKY